MRNILRKVGKIRLALALVAVIAIVAAVFWISGTLRRTSITIESEKKIDITPEQIRSIKAIGEWEFLSINDEELVDTTRKGLFRNDHLVRIYYGTMRLGFDLKDAKEDWIKASGDTVEVTLPPIRLLDSDFIDEAKTRSFYESGRWSAADREKMYRKAKAMMLRNGLTPTNIRSAENNADAQFRNMFRAMGFENVVIRFSN